MSTLLTRLPNCPKRDSYNQCLARRYDALVTWFKSDAKIGRKNIITPAAFNPVPTDLKITDASRLLQPDFPQAADLELLQHNTAFTWRVRDKISGAIWYLKQDRPNLMLAEEVGYRLAEACRVNIPRWSKINIAEIAAPELGAQTDNTAFLFRDVEAMPREELRQKGSSGIEEILVFLAFTGGIDFRLDNNIMRREIDGRTSYIIFDLPSVADGALRATRGDFEVFSFGYAVDLVASAVHLFRPERFAQAVERVESLDRQVFCRIARESGLEDGKVDAFADYLEGRKKDLRATVMAGLEDALFHSPWELILNALPARPYPKADWEYFNCLLRLNRNPGSNIKELWPRVLTESFNETDFPLFQKLLKSDRTTLRQWALENNPYLVTNLKIARNLVMLINDLLDQGLNGFKHWTIDESVRPDLAAALAEGKTLLATINQQIDNLKDLNNLESRFYQVMQAIACQLSA